MKIENIELYYLSMPEVLDEADGSQDALIVKVEGGGLVGWGECEASPLTSIANFVCPKSHSAANPVRDSIINQKLNNLEDVKKLGINPDEMIDIGVQCSLEQLLEHGFFHADPHPGNLLALEDGRLCYLDFGMMSDVSRESRSGLIQAVVHLVNKNFDKLSQDFVKLGFLSEDAVIMSQAGDFFKRCK